MISSMTGYGAARLRDERWTVDVEIRSVNFRHFKLSSRISSPYDALEPDLERLFRDQIRRGSVQFNLRIDAPHSADDYRINTVALRSYRDQVLRLLETDAGPYREPPSWEAFLLLPGIVQETRTQEHDPHADWPMILAVVNQALAQFQASRQDEGRAMTREMLALGRSVAGALQRIQERSTLVVDSYRDRLLERVQNVLRDLGAGIEPKDVIREIAIYADRVDITEEIIRLRAHLEQFEQIFEREDLSGRLIEFLLQEMVRETNTIGSKANDVEITRLVVEIKSALEKLRELVQNLE